MELTFLFLIGAVLCHGIKTVFLRLGILEGSVNKARFVRALFQTFLVIFVASFFRSPSFAIPFKFEIIFPILNGLLGGFAFVAFCKGLEMVEASTAKPILAIRMAVPVALGVMVLGETMTLKKGLGIVMAGLAVFLLSSRN